MRCRPSLVRGRAAQVNPGGFTTPARRPSVPHRTAGCGKSSLRPLMAGSSPSLPDGSNPSAAIVQSASDVQCSRLLKTTMEVVAEGVETPDCLAWLRQAGCDTVQGFLFARPMPAAAFVGFVNQWRNTTMNANEPSTSCCVCCKFAVPAYGPQNDVTLKMPAFEWVHVQLHQQKGMISLSPPTICNSAGNPARCRLHAGRGRVRGAFLRAGVLSALPGAGQHCDRNQRQTGRL